MDRRAPRAAALAALLAAASPSMAAPPAAAPFPAAAPAVPAAAEEPEVILRFRDGRLLPGRVVALRDEGVLHASDTGRILWRWEDLTPYGAYEVREAVLAEDDGAGRLDLARRCLKSGLPSEARTEALRARGLGAGSAAEVEAILSLCDEDQARAAMDEAERLAEADDFAGAFAALSAWLRIAPPSDWTLRGRQLAEDLARRREASEERRRIEKEQERRAGAEGRKDRYLEETLAAADAARAEGGRAALVVLREEYGGALGRMRAAAAEAEARFLDAKKLYDRARRAAGNDRPDGSREAAEGRRATDGRLLDLYLRLARSFVAQKMWREAQEALDRALRLDPVNEEGLDLQDKVRENWKRKKLSDITNATGRTTDGSGR
jgi:tetratricopeptide (TPR) repeat protein